MHTWTDKSDSAVAVQREGLWKKRRGGRESATKKRGDRKTTAVMKMDARMR
jgi:hypothetical protein